MRILRIGDPHIRPSNIEESEHMLEMALYIAKTNKIDRIEILGDLMHTHSIIRLEVLEFWDRWLKKLSSNGHDLVVLIGNHDLSGDYHSAAHALKVFKPMENLRQSHAITIVDEPVTKGIYAYLPYYHNPEHFLTSARYLATHEDAKVLVCHQTLGGAQYENGFYAPDAIDPSTIPFDLIISGHIHKRQIINAGGKTIIYPGTPRWDSVSDANEDKGIVLYIHDDKTGEIVSTEFFSTAKVCRPIVSILWNEGEEMPILPDSNARLHVELAGSSDWIKEQKERFQGKASIKAKTTDTRLARMKSGTNFEYFINNVFQTKVRKEDLLNYMRRENLV
jgi:DNA repair exonuclease SbcCD nuclease subunit